MFNCATEITDYYNGGVIIPEPTRSALRGYRKANQDRLKAGLSKAGKSSPKGFIKQGSYAMRTTIQHPANDYDIDDGAVFDPADLVGARGAAMSSLDARQMVCDALQDDRFNRAPAVRPNCVRVYYNEGHHVDIPIYRELTDPWGKVSYEFASSDWKESNPTIINDWFNSAVISKSPDSDNGRQMRRVVCLVKQFARSRSTWNMPSGFALSVMVDEQYAARMARDDESLYETMRAIYNRLIIYTEVRNPTSVTEVLLATDDAKIIQLRDKLKFAIDTLEPTTRANCTRLEALKAWKQVFNTDHFDAQIKAEEDKRETVDRMAAGVSSAPKPWSLA